MTCGAKHKIVHNRKPDVDEEKSPQLVTPFEDTNLNGTDVDESASVIKLMPLNFPKFSYSFAEVFKTEIIMSFRVEVGFVDGKIELKIRN